MARKKPEKDHPSLLIRDSLSYPNTRSQAKKRQQTNNGLGDDTNITSTNSKSSLQTPHADDCSRMNKAGSSRKLPHGRLAADRSKLPVVSPENQDLGSVDTEALEAMSESDDEYLGPPKRVKVNQDQGGKAATKRSKKASGSGSKTGYILTPTDPLDPDTRKIYRPVDPVKEPLRAAAMLEVEAGEESRKNREAAAKWREESARKREEWLREHGDEFYLNKMRHNFKGWVELEADPDYFTIMLKRLGVERAEVVEVHSLDDMLSKHHVLKYGIIFLSKYYDEGLDTPEGEVPQDLWFCNQVVDNACATVAILNIVNNVKPLDIGESLNSFKNFTKTFVPPLKGEALANFVWCRSIHNAFAKRTEMLIANLALQQEATANESSSKARGNSKGKGKAKGNAKDTPNHYIAYVPFDGYLWKLDGMDLHPRNLGPLVDGEAWINTVRDDIQRRMALMPGEDSGGCTILGIVQDKLPMYIDMLGRNVNHLIWYEFCISEKRDYWNRSVATEPRDNRWPVGREPLRGPGFRYNLTQKVLNSRGVNLTYAQKLEISTCSEEHLSWLRPSLVDEQQNLKQLIIPLKAEKEAQWQKYKDRMFDYGPFIHQWLKFLDENGTLEALVDDQIKWDKKDKAEAKAKAAKAKAARAKESDAEKQIDAETEIDAEMEDDADMDDVADMDNDVDMESDAEIESDADVESNAEEESEAEKESEGDA